MLDKQMFFIYNISIKRTNVLRRVKMERVKNIIKDVLFILVVITIFHTIINYQLAKTEYKTYEHTVKSGETIWNLASSICSEKEELYIKNVINDIREINDLEDPTIYVGQVINLPIYD